MRGSQGGRYPLSKFEIINIELIANASQVLESGLYSVGPMTDVYGQTWWANMDVNIQVFTGGDWRTYPSDASKIQMPFFSDGVNVRVINDDGVNTHRLVGVRMY